MNSLGSANAIKLDAIDVILATLTAPNRLACQISLATGMRIGDVLALGTETVRKIGKSGILTYREEKTGKTRRTKIPQDLIAKMNIIGHGSFWVFTHRLDRTRHRTRQAVYKDLRRAKTMLRLKGTVSCHSMRKTYAIRRYRACGDMRHVKKLLNHSAESVTMIYAMAVEIGLRST